jgi:hypothetical protein
VISQLPEIALHLPLGLAFAPTRAGEYGLKRLRVGLSARTA